LILSLIHKFTVHLKIIMKVRLLLLLILFATTASTAQVDKKAQDILKAVSAKYKSLKSIKATFSITIENTKDKSQDVQNGVLYLKGQKYKLEIAGQDILSDGKTRWTYVKDANEIQIDNQRTDENAITPTNIFTIYEKGWLSKYTGEQKDKNGSMQMIELVPTDAKSKNIFKVKLTINKTQKTITSAKVYDKNGSIQTISVQKLIPDGATEDSLFVFNSSKYPGSEIIDLR
jgi:outer membrane lipoprotein carrier protein